MKDYKRIRLEEGSYNLVVDKIERDSNRIYIWDFDKVLFDFNGFSLKPFHIRERIKSKEITTHKELKLRGLEFKEGDFLLTGRPSFQKESILKILNSKGYSFGRAIFRPVSSLVKSFIPFIHNHFYRQFKLEEMLKLKKEFGRKIIAIDDNLKLISLYEENGIDYIFFNIKSDFIYF
jgi:hypothetical protein